MENPNRLRHEDFVFVSKDADLCFRLIGEDARWRYYRIAVFDLEGLRETAKLEPCKTGKTLRVFEYFLDQDLRCQEPFMGPGIDPALVDIGL